MKPPQTPAAGVAPVQTYSAHSNMRKLTDRERELEELEVSGEPATFGLTLVDTDCLVVICQCSAMFNLYSPGRSNQISVVLLVKGP